MIFRYLALLALCTAMASSPAWAVIQAKSYPCYWVAGRLFYSNGTPDVRIWPRGSHRLLGVLNRKSESEADDIMPDSVLRLDPSFERSIWGRFRVCPLTPERVGWMRMVYIDVARNLKIVR